MRRTLPTFLASLLLCLLALPLAAQDDVTVSSQFSPPVVTLGQRAEYQISVQGTTATPEGRLPDVDGLDIAPSARTSTSMEIVNFERTVTITYSFAAEPRREGTFEVPAWPLTVGGQRLTVPPATLRVVPPGEAMRDAIQLRLQLPKDTLYAGETVPGTLRFMVREDVRARPLTLPEKRGDAFTMSALSTEPPRTRETVNGQPFLVYNWPLTLTALKAGDATLEFTIEVGIIEEVGARRSRDPFDRFFNSPLDDFFDRGREVQRTISSRELALPIASLPTPAPDGFTGAIGNFTTSATLDRDTVQAGEPVALTLTVSGEGNFARIAPPALPEDDRWRLYPPKVDFDPADDHGFRGTKTFEYIFIPQDDRLTSAPPLDFASFDPATGVYRPAELPPLPLEVMPAPVGTQMGLPQSYRPAPREADDPGARLLPIRLLAGTWHPGLYLPWERAWVAWVQLLPLLLLMGLIVWRRHQRRLAEDPHFARRLRGGKAVRQALAEARAAAQRDDAEAFFRAGQRALQEAAARVASGSAAAMTQAETDAVLARHNVSDEVRTAVAEFFSTSDALKFAGRRDHHTALQAWRDRLPQLVNDILRAA